jgi:hypothetical protein
MKNRKIAVLALLCVPLISCRQASPLVDLLVLVDVSESLDRATISQEPEVFLRFIEDDRPEYFPSGGFDVFVFDRDVERNRALRGEKYENFSSSDSKRQHEKFESKKKELANFLTAYCQRYPERKHTCIVKTMQLVPAFWSAASSGSHRRILIISDMLEDCYAKGDPSSKDELDARLRQSLQEYPLKKLGGEVISVVVGSPKPGIEINDLRNLWGSALSPSGALLTRIGPPTEHWPDFK